MVKILASFNDVDTQNLLSPKGEPHAIHCSNGCLFMALDSCLVEAYRADTAQLLAQVRTVGPVVRLIYNGPWDCIVTLERKHAESHNFVRLYFNWRSSSTEMPVRVLVAHTASPRDVGVDSTPSSSSSALTEIVELPTEEDRHIKCLASCERTGVIAVGMSGLLRLFSVRKNDGAARVISTLCNVTLEMKVLKVAIFCNYVACVSSSEVRVLKVCWYDGDERYGLKNYAPDHVVDPRRRHPGGPNAPTPVPNHQNIGLDASFIEWSPRCVRDAEGNIFMTGEEEKEDEGGGGGGGGSRAPPTPSTPVGLLHLRSISKATADKDGTGEVLGPVDNIRGQEVEVEASDPESGEKVGCHISTMLYRRFAPKAEVSSSPTTSFTSDPKVKSGTVAEQQSVGGRKGNDARGKTATQPPAGDQKSKNVASPVQENVPDAPHSVELLPTLVDGPSGTVLVGLSCLVASQHQGYIYDVHQRTRRVSTFSFNSRTLAASCGSGLLYTLSEDSLDAYTCRVFPSCLARSPSCSRCVGSEDVGGDDLASLWLCQPCPPSSMDMTLVSTNKFIGAHSMACSKGYVVVLTKEVTSLSSSQENAYASNWFLQSLPLRRMAKPSPREASWNVYILKMKPLEAMYHQFMEFASTLKDSSPPMHQHLLKEGHLLLRSELLHNWPPLPDKVRLLRENCQALATSLCAYPAANRDTPTSAIAEYLVMSGCPIAKVVQTITSMASQSKTKPAQEEILCTYLEIVLFEKGNALKEGPALTQLGNQVLDLYAECRPHRLAYLLLYSWYQTYDKDRALTLLEGCQRSVPVGSNHVISLCQAYLCVQLQRNSDAVRKLSLVPKDFLIMWMKEHSEFVVDREKLTTTPLGKIISENQDNCFMEFMTHSFAEGRLGFEPLCSVLKLSKTTAESYQLKQFLEKVILGHVRAPDGDTCCNKKAVLLLVEVLVSRGLLSGEEEEDGLTTSTTPSTTIMFGSRYKWLDSLATPIIMDAYYSTPDIKELESLLCSCHVNPEVARCVDRNLDGRGKGAAETLPLRLLTWPHMGKLDEAVKLIMSTCPGVLVDFCLTYFGSDLVLWKRLLATLLHEIQRGDNGPHKSTLYPSLLQRTLEYVVTITTVEEFVGLLPQNGSLRFFLPALEQSCKLFMSRQIAQQLQCGLAA